MGNQFLIAEDEALKGFLQGMVVADEKSAAVNGPTGTIKTRPVKVWFGYPDVEVRAQEFPFVTIDLVDIVHANDRQHQGVIYDTDYMGTQAPQAGYIYEYNLPVAFDIIYQITTYARHPRHDRAILFQTGWRSMFVDGYVKRDTFEDAESGNRRLLRNVFTVRVVSEMTPATAAERTAVVQEVIINVPTANNTSNIPTGLQPL